MKKHLIPILSFLFAFSIHAANEVAFSPVYTNYKFTLPVAGVTHPDGSGRIFLVEQGGVIEFFQRTVVLLKRLQFF